MTVKEIDTRIKAGERLSIIFHIKRNYYKIGNERLTEKQYNAAKNRFNDQLDCECDFGGITEHHYTIKK